MRKFGLIGFPLGQSFSKQFFTEKFATEQLHNCVYDSYSLPSIEGLKVILKDPELEGLNVTIPYKKEVISYLDEQDEVVKDIRACNVIHIKQGKLKGYNTDVIGFERSLQPLLKTYHKKALVLGTGGSSAAVEFVLKKLNIEYLFVSRKKGDKINIITYDDIDRNLLDLHKLLINTTPLGMYPRVESSPSIPYQHLTKHHLLFDLIYNPEKTMFLQKGEDYGATIKNGKDMLVIQAEESWKIWNRR